MERQIQARPRLSQPLSGVRRSARGASRVQPVVGFVGVQQIRKSDVQHTFLAEKATEWLHLLNTRQLRALDDLVGKDAVCHDDGMWLLQPAKGRSAIRNVWRDWLRAIPDYKIDVLNIATEPATNDAFIMWRAAGTSRLSLIPQRPTTNKPFEHCGVTRLRLDPDTGLIQDMWTWRGATADEAKWLMNRSYKPLDCEAFIDISNTTKSNEGRVDTVVKARATGAALAFREVFGAVQGADVANLTSALSEDYQCKEATGVWRAVNLANREACIDYCQQRQEQLSGSPYWHSEAMTSDGKLLYVHFQNVLMDKQSKTLMGLSSGILVHAFDDQQKISRSMMFRGPMSLSERAQFFAMDCRGCGNSQAEKLGVDESLFGGM